MGLRGQQSINFLAYKWLRFFQLSIQRVYNCQWLLLLCWILLSLDWVTSSSSWWRTILWSFVEGTKAIFGLVFRKWLDGTYCYSRFFVSVKSCLPTNVLFKCWFCFLKLVYRLGCQTRFLSYLFCFKVNIIRSISAYGMNEIKKRFLVASLH